MKKIIAAICLSILIIMTLAGCSGGKTEDVKETTSNNGVVGDEYYYASEKISETQGYKFMSQNDNGQIAFIDSLSNKVTIIDKDGKSNVIDLNIDEEVQRFGISNEEIYINPSGENSSNVYVYNFDGKLVKTDKNDIFKEEEFEGKIYKASKSDLKKINNCYYFYKSRQLKKLNLETELVESVFNNFTKMDTISNKKAYGVSPGEKNTFLEVNLKNAESKILFEKENFFSLMAITKNLDGILGINYGNEIVNIGETGEVLEKISLKEKGDQLFIGDLMVNKIIGDLNTFYIQVVKPNPKNGELNNELYKITKKKGINEFKENQKKITLYTHNEEFILKRFSETFMKDNINISIEIKSFPELSTNDYMKKINSEILSGNNVDLVLYDKLPVRKLIEKEFLADLTSVAKSKVSNNMLNALSYKNKVYGLPYEVNFTNMYFDNEKMNNMVEKYLEDNSYENYIRLLEYLSKDNIDATRKLDKSEIFEVFIQSSIDEIVNIDKKSFNKEKLKELLNAVNVVTNSKFMNNEMGKDEFIFNGYGGKIALDLQKKGTINEIAYKNVLFDNKSYKLLPAPSENKGSTINGNMIGVLEKSKNKEEAIRFLEYITLNEDVQNSMIGFDMASLNPEIIKEKAKNTTNQGQVTIVYGKETKYGNRSIEQKAPSTEAYNEYAKQYENISNSTFYYNDLIDLVNMEVKDMYEKDGSIDEMLSRLESKLYIYLNE